MKMLLRLCVVVASVLSGASAQADLKVGVLISLTGYGAALGAPVRNTVELLPNTLGGQKALKPWQLRLYGILTPLFRVLDGILPMSGLSTIVVGRKPAAYSSSCCPNPAS